MGSVPRNEVTAPACSPERECASASTRQLVSRSGTRTGTVARPEASVTTSGSKRNVSGNQARAACAPDAALSPSGAPGRSWPALPSSSAPAIRPCELAAGFFVFIARRTSIFAIRSSAIRSPTTPPWSSSGAGEDGAGSPASALEGARAWNSQPASARAAATAIRRCVFMGSPSRPTRSSSPRPPAAASR